jgi:Glycine cleavage system regulatory protein
MRKILVTIVGHDRPGIIYQVSRALADYRCNVVEVSQTTLLGEFAGIFSCALPASADLDELRSILGEYLSGSNLAYWVTDLEGNGHVGDSSGGEREPYVVTVRGRDRLGIIPEFSGVMAGFEINIDNLRAVALKDDAPAEGRLDQADAAEGDHQVVLFFELSVPRTVKQGAFRQALALIAEDLKLEVSLQHRDIFEAIHRL